MGGSGQVIINLDRFSPVGLWGKLVWTWSVAPEVNNEVSLASRLPLTALPFYLSVPQTDGQGWTEVLWVLPEARDLAHRRWMLRFLVTKKKKKFKGLKKKKRKRKGVGWVGGERKGGGQPGMLLS